MRAHHKLASPLLEIAHPVAEADIPTAVAVPRPLPAPTKLPRRANKRPWALPEHLRPGSGTWWSVRAPPTSTGMDSPGYQRLLHLVLLPPSQLLTRPS